jgi:hypothetical protein
MLQRRAVGSLNFKQPPIQPSGSPAATLSHGRTPLGTDSHRRLRLSPEAGHAFQPLNREAQHKSSASQAMSRSLRCRCRRRAVLRGALPWCRVSKQMFNLEFFASDSRCFIPVYVPRPNGQSHPPSQHERFPQNLESHRSMILAACDTVKDAGPYRTVVEKSDSSAAASVVISRFLTSWSGS